MGEAIGELEYGGFWPRLGAAITDGLIVGGCLWLLFMVAVFAVNETFAFVVYLLLPQGSWMYSTLQHGRWGQTIGKRAAGLRVVEVATGAPIGYGRAAARDCANIFAADWQLLIGTASIIAGESFYGNMGTPGTVVTWAFVAWWIASCLVLVFQSRHRTLHDFIAGTIVVGVRPRAARPAGSPPAIEIVRRPMSRGF
jgi:uncharacterized RDD family membrane protein YckC